ncbi:hypothetical protein [Trichocoleus sp. FACHB-46]|uniref:Uncharacterized protein n=1 Tax=Trichocoleus desertorum GB2-A4 TaxID=2933944 RepID=A0ABV0J8C8_9CYAN|nr:hypothetical protein [Trichocoleus sp. FACHB-46]MBD1861050.1 hypothetical protein [Trichocoleus sp. FACHB-46]
MKETRLFRQYGTALLRNCFNVKVYLAPPEALRSQWKINCGTHKRGYTEDQTRF